jgi:murein DD-endopeptidase MepM/ murein hydrolase activator NlpD
MFLFAACAGSVQAELRVDAPAAAPLGLPFYVNVSEPELEKVRVDWLGRTISPKVAGGGIAVLLGVGLATEAGAHELKVTARAGGETFEVTRKITVKSRKYPEQHLNVARKMVHLSREQLDRHYKEKGRTGAVLQSSHPERFWECPFERPVPGAVTSAFGLRRFFNGEPRKPHSGVDLRAAEGAPIKSMAAGIVALAEEHYFSGNVVYLDHGQGVVSMYCHLSEIKVEEGRFVSKGDVIGLAGSTGRVTGPHLHFGVGILGQMVDPLELLNAGCPKLSEGS